MYLKKLYHDYFHGKGYKAYKLEESQKGFLNGLIKLSDKCFWAPIASLLVYSLKPSIEASLVFWACVIIFYLGMVMRHYAFKEIDNINLRKYEKEKFNKFRPHRPCGAGCVKGVRLMKKT